MAFRIGQKVVCIDDSIPQGGTVYSKRLRCTFRLLGDLSGLKRGAIYTVRGIDIDWADDLPVLFLEEIVRPPFHTEQQETGFDQRRFRPLQERKRETSIAVFERLLGPQPHPSRRAQERAPQDEGLKGRRRKNFDPRPEEPAESRRLEGRAAGKE